MKRPDEKGIHELDEFFQWLNTSKKSLEAEVSTPKQWMEDKAYIKEGSNGEATNHGDMSKIISAMNMIGSKNGLKEYVKLRGKGMKDKEGS